ncbi:MAG TPA: hypothetical protein PLU38_02550 [Kiritimatiellia bacterium]|nr:MAG: hypothetical protein BWX70_02132 [Verrucomicrobia bacterium ADurb.Bin070]HPO37540.1 hypothetical protein [Kiritimatiellia bacterium]HQQ90722.1 hypothetical protein [Kiritimatiellia bacterium]
MTALDFLNRVDATGQSWHNTFMVRMQIQLPDILYSEAKQIASEREISFAEVVRRGVEYITRICPPLETGDTRVFVGFGFNRVWNPLV